MEHEQWKTISGFEESYEVSSFGRVRSLDRIVKSYSPTSQWQKRKLQGRILRPKINSYGYYSVFLRRNNKPYENKVHLLVLNAFVGKRPVGFHSRHLDGNRLNNNIGNLVYGTPQENCDDTIRHGTRQRGMKHPQHKLTDQDVLLIREQVAAGIQQKDLANQFNVSRSLICLIIKRKLWPWVQGQGVRR